MLGAWILPLCAVPGAHRRTIWGTSLYGSRGGGAGSRGAVNSVGCHVCLTDVTAETLAPLSRPFPGLIDSLSNGHSFLFEELWQRLRGWDPCLLGSRQGGTSGRMGKVAKGTTSSPSGTRDPSQLLLHRISPHGSNVIRAVAESAGKGVHKSRVLTEQMNEGMLAEEVGLNSTKQSLTHSRFATQGVENKFLLFSFLSPIFCLC